MSTTVIARKIRRTGEAASATVAPISRAKTAELQRAAIRMEECRLRKNQLDSEYKKLRKQLLLEMTELQLKEFNASGLAQEIAHELELRVYREAKGGGTVSYIDPVKLAKLVDNKTFMQCITVLKGEATKLVGENVLAKAETVGKVPKGEEEVYCDVLVNKPAGGKTAKSK